MSDLRVTLGDTSLRKMTVTFLRQSLSDVRHCGRLPQRPVSSGLLARKPARHYLSICGSRSAFTRSSLQ